jgi:hypothetical protein
MHRLTARLATLAPHEQLLFGNLLGYAGTSLVAGGLFLATGVALRLSFQAPLAGPPLLYAFEVARTGLSVAADIGASGMLLLGGFTLIAAGLRQLR